MTMMDFSWLGVFIRNSSGLQSESRGSRESVVVRGTKPKAGESGRGEKERDRGTERKRGAGRVRPEQTDRAINSQPHALDSSVSYSPLASLLRADGFYHHHQNQNHQHHHRHLHHFHRRHHHRCNHHKKPKLTVNSASIVATIQTHQKMPRLAPDVSAHYNIRVCLLSWLESSWSVSGGGQPLAIILIPTSIGFATLAYAPNVL